MKTQKQLFEDKVRQIVKEELSNEFTVGQSVTLKMPYMSSSLQFKAKIIKITNNRVKLSYSTHGEQVTTECPIDWIS